MITPITLGNNKEYDITPIGNSFIDKIHKFFLTLLGWQMNIVVLDQEKKCDKVYTISKCQYQKVLRRAVEETVASQMLSPKIIKTIVQAVVNQTRTEAGIVLPSQLKNHTTAENFKQCVHDFLESKATFKIAYSYGDGDCDQLDKLGFKTNESKQKFLLEYAQSSPEAARNVFNFLLRVATNDAKAQSYGHSGYEYLPSYEKIKVVLGVKDFILEQDKSKVRSFLSQLLKNVLKANPALKKEIKENLAAFSLFPCSIYTHSVQSRWYDGDGPLRTNQWITDTHYCGLRGGYLDHLEFLTS